MDKKALQSFALFAKDSLETQIKVSLKLIGIHSDKDIKKAYIQGDFTIIDGDSKTYPSDLKVKRDHILELIKTDGYAYTIEQFAYTWFNRLIALRFMEVHDYLPHGFKVFPKGNGSIEPEILGKLTLVEKELNLDIELCRQFKEKAQIEELYRYVVFQQCNALSGVLPMLFSKEYAYLELMLPSTLLKGTTVITELIKIDESNFLDDVEVIGWLYQFYISVKKDEVYASKDLISKDTLPAVTQLFTPDWIVRYMTENSLGRLWLESYPDSSVKKEFKYYVEDAEQTEEVKKQIESIRYKNVDPKDIKVIEPCSGSGHILVYAFDVLMLIYEEKGYSKNDIPKLILDNNLFGLDVDKRASQLASFSLVMKARSIDSRFFQTNRISYPKVFEIKDSKMLMLMDYKKKLLDLNNNDWKKDEHLSDDELKVVDYIIETFFDGKVIGSLLKVKRDNYVSLISKINHLHKVTIRGIFNGEFVEYGLKRIVQLLRLAEVMSRRYDVLITNPPYIGLSSFELSIKAYFNTQYPDTKADMFSMFMDTDYVTKNGFVSIINMHSWLFLSSFEEFRKKLHKKQSLDSLVHLGAHAFEMISGEIVQTCAFVLRNNSIDKNCQFFDLTNKSSFADKEASFLYKDCNIYSRKISSFKVIPQNVFSYKLNDSVISIFSKKSRLKEVITAVKGLDTCDNEKYVRIWYEVNIKNINFYVNDISETNEIKWYPYAKGGGSRKWYGLNDKIVNWQFNGKELKNIRDSKGKIKSRPQNMSYYFKKGLTYSSISGKALSLRYFDNSIFGGGGSGVFSDKNIYVIQGFLNSIVANYLLSNLNTTLNYLVNDILNLPFDFSFDVEKVETLVKDCINISKLDSDTLETTRNFSRHILMCENNLNMSLRRSFEKWSQIAHQRFMTLKNNEQELNRIFIDAYGLSGELVENISTSDISVLIPNEKRDISSLLSYLVGVSMGRFSIIKEGLVYAGGEFDFSQYGNFLVSKTGIISVSDYLGTSDSITNNVLQLIEQIFGKEKNKENITFIAECLGKKENETSHETINNYFYTDFYFNHIKVYQNRPIYWMFSSGKYGAFKCLVYMHRYNEDTLATINSQYLLPESTRLKYELNELNNQLVKADDKTRRILEKEKVVLENKYNEIIEYGQVLDHMANRYISIDLDDGVKVNYEKFQGIEIVTDSGTRIKKDLLVPIK